MQVDTNVAEADVGKLQDGMDATFTVDAYPGERFRGKVRQIRNAPQTVQNVVTYDAVIDVPNPDLKLRPGMTANVSFVYAQRGDVLRVPNAALRFRPTREMLAAMTGAPPGARRGAGSGAGDSAATPVETAGSPPSPRAPGANGGNGGRSGEARAGRETPGTRTVYVLRAGAPVAVPVQAGVSDGTVTEVVSGDVHEGDACVVDASGGAARQGGPPGPGGPGGMRRVL